eukprot:2555427-Rhodomonas_salina.2
MGDGVQIGRRGGMIPDRRTCPFCFIHIKTSAKLGCATVWAHSVHYATKGGGSTPSARDGQAGVAGRAGGGGPEALVQRSGALPRGSGTAGGVVEGVSCDDALPQAQAGVLDSSDLGGVEPESCPSVSMAWRQSTHRPPRGVGRAAGVVPCHYGSPSVGQQKLRAWSLRMSSAWVASSGRVLS